MIPASEQLLDAAGVGRRLIMSPRTVSEMALDGRLPYFRIGIYQRFKWAHVENSLRRVPVKTPDSACHTDHGTTGPNNQRSEVGDQKSAN